MPTDYQSLVERINNENTYEGLKRLEISLDRLYNAGIFSVSEFKRLDSKIIEKLVLTKI